MGVGCFYRGRGSRWGGCRGIWGKLGISILFVLNFLNIIFKDLVLEGNR